MANKTISKLATVIVSATILTAGIVYVEGREPAVRAFQVEETPRQTRTISSSAALAVATETADDEAHSFAEYQAVEEALQPYIEAAKTGDGALVRTAFYDHAHIVGSVDGEFINRDADAFSDAFGDESPDIKHHIAWIDISGPAAAAKVEFINWNGFRFTDFFVLYKQNGQWKISGKVYDSHARN